MILDACESPFSALSYAVPCVSKFEKEIYFGPVFVSVQFSWCLVCDPQNSTSKRQGNGRGQLLAGGVLWGVGNERSAVPVVVFPAAAEAGRETGAQAHLQLTFEAWRCVLLCVATGCSKSSAATGRSSTSSRACRWVAPPPTPSVPRPHAGLPSVPSRWAAR